MTKLTPEEIKERRKQATKIWRENNKSKWKSSKKKWVLANKEKVRQYNKDKYAKNREKAIKVASLNRLLRIERKAGKPRTDRCQVPECGRIGKVVFDHDHSNNKFRDWICDKCNRILGIAEDNPNVLRGLAAFIEYHKARHG